MLISLLIFLIIVAAVYWAVTYLPTPEPVRRIVIVVLALIAVLWLVGLLTGRDFIHL